MTTQKKKPTSLEKNYRIRFKNEAQLAIVRKAALRHGIPFNTFVRDAAEQTAIRLLKTPARNLDEVAMNAMLQAFAKE